jgi:hypothetical protein
MPLTKGLRDEENERIDNLLKQLLSLVLIPENTAPISFSEVLGQLALSMDDIKQSSSGSLTAHLNKLHFDWANMEQFADLLVKLSKPKTAIDIYEYIQQQSQTFSFGIFNKIASAKQ